MLKRLGLLGDSQVDSFANGFFIGCLMFVVTISVTVYELAGKVVDYCTWTLP